MLKFTSECNSNYFRKENDFVPKEKHITYGRNSSINLYIFARKYIRTYVCMGQYINKNRAEPTD